MTHQEPHSRPRQLSAINCVSNSLHILPTVDHRPQKLVIARGGASYHIPEHTIPAYQMALELGADSIISSIVATKDGKLIAMHSVDLNMTTNVEEVFGSTVQPWYSPHSKREGYWTFNFTYDEISQLRVKQRLPEGRSTEFDYVFPVPLLEEVVDLMVIWNQDRLPGIISHTEKVVDEDSTEQELDPDRDVVLRTPTPLELAESGIVLELKDVDWLFQEADLDTVNLLMQHMEDHNNRWQHLFPCFHEVKYNTYKVPGLVLQSHNGDALKRFHKKWIGSKDPTEVPEPPYVLLVDTKRCNSDRFWASVRDNYRATISGISPDKECVLTDSYIQQRNGNTTTGNRTRYLQEEEPRTLRKAREFNLVVHPWSEKPEKDFLAKNGDFNTAQEETSFLFCEVGAQGIHTEAVVPAVSAARVGCDSDIVDPAYPITELPRDGVGQVTPPTCVDSHPWFLFCLAWIFFFMGILFAFIAACLHRRKERRDIDGRIAQHSEGYSDNPRTAKSVAAKSKKKAPKLNKDPDLLQDIRQKKDDLSSAAAKLKEKSTKGNTAKTAPGGKGSKPPSKTAPASGKGSKPASKGAKKQASP
mmetsp:Transcript_24764/g.68479  ORF Transcript_24764/g.68479 Transcript_24764/m.68479 type:complete len:586 (+) Transcript_24764:18-1775(+)